MYLKKDVWWCKLKTTEAPTRCCTHIGYVQNHVHAKALLQSFQSSDQDHPVMQRLTVSVVLLTVLIHKSPLLDRLDFLHVQSGCRHQ